MTQCSRLSLGTLYQGPSAQASPLGPSTKGSVLKSAAGRCTAMNGAVGFEASAKVMYSCWSRIPPLHHVSASWWWSFHCHRSFVNVIVVSRWSLRCHWSCAGGRCSITGRLSRRLLSGSSRCSVTGRVSSSLPCSGFINRFPTSLLCSSVRPSAIAEKYRSFVNVVAV